MTEIEKTEGEIKVLQAKLELLKEMEKHKTPCEEAFKRVYGFYPETYEDSWSSFQDGYIAAQKDYKVQEPEELKTLYQMFENEGAYGQIYFDDALKVVKSWMSQYEINGWEDDWDVGFSDCFYKLNKGLK